MRTETPARCPDENVLIAFAERTLRADAREPVEVHLDACAECLAIVCDLLRFAENGRADGAMTLPSRKDELVPGAPRTGMGGDRGGRYMLLATIGEGAMGSVYAARDTVLDRKIALKVLRSHRLQQPEARARLSREARAMAKVSHAHVVMVFDTGEIDDGIFVSMEFVEGVTLAAWLRAYERPWRDILDAFLGAGRGLAAAHAAGIVHRHFKPENVLVDRGDHPAVTDFGLAAMAMAPTNHGDKTKPSIFDLTRPGAVLGTPRYMSAEQFAGANVDARTDQFSFAVALYEALYGEHPFAGATLDEHIENVEHGRVKAAPRIARAPPALRAVLVRALRPRPEERFPGMDALLEALEKSALDRCRTLRRGRVPAAAFVCALVLAAGVTLVVARRGSAGTREAATMSTAPMGVTAIARPDDPERTAGTTTLVPPTPATPIAAFPAPGAAPLLPEVAPAVASARASAARAPRILRPSTPRNGSDTDAPGATPLSSPRKDEYPPLPKIIRSAPTLGHARGAFWCAHLVEKTWRHRGTIFRTTRELAQQWFKRNHPRMRTGGMPMSHAIPYFIIFIPPTTWEEQLTSQHPIAPFRREIQSARTLGCPWCVAEMKKRDGRAVAKDASCHPPDELQG